MRLLTRQTELVEFVARRTQWVSSTGIPVDKSLIGSLSGNKTLVGFWSRKGAESVVGVFPSKTKRDWHFLPSFVLQVTGAGVGTNARAVPGAGAGVGVGEQPIS